MGARGLLSWCFRFFFACSLGTSQPTPTTAQLSPPTWNHPNLLRTIPTWPKPVSLSALSPRLSLSLHLFLFVSAHLSSLFVCLIKGPAVAVVGDTWRLVEPLTTIDWFAPMGLPEKEKSGGSGGGKQRQRRRLHQDSAAAAAPDSAAPASGDGSSSDSGSGSGGSGLAYPFSEARAAIEAALSRDLTPDLSGTNPEGNLVDPKWQDPYGFGKAVAKVKKIGIGASFCSAFAPLLLVCPDHSC